MKKILFLINTLKSGGAEKVLIDTVNSLDPNQYQVTVQTVLADGENREGLSDHIRYKAMIHTKNGLLRRILTNVLFKVLGADMMYRFFVKDDYDYEIAFLEGHPTKIVSKSTNQTAKKYAWVHTDLNANPNSALAYGSSEREEAAYQIFDKIVCVSESVKREFLKKYAVDERKVVVVYNIVDDSVITECAKEPADLQVTEKPVLISVGRLVQQKGYDRLLRVHLRLMREGLKHSLVVIGDGELRNELSDFVQQNHLTDSVKFLGYQSNPHKYVSKADVFVCSSYAEGYSTVVSEAVLCGTPVLSTDVAGANEPETNPRCSIIVENSEEALYESMKELLMEPQRIQVLREDLERRKASLKKDHLVSEFERILFGEK
jgi:glycosyltransferase involved in cell wall biosynthesis